MNRACARQGAATALALTVLAVGGCGSSSPSGTSPARYVKSICTTLRTWSGGIQRAGTTLTNETRGTTSLLKGKQQYEAFVAALIGPTAAAASEIEAAGTPAVKHGKQISNDLLGAFRQANAGLSVAAKAAAAIPTSGAAAYQAAESGATVSIRQTLAAMATASPSRDPTLRAASLKEPACRALG